MSCTTRFFPRMLIVGTLTVAMTSGLAFAQGGGPRDGRSDGNNGPRSSRMIQLLDIDGDGKVSLAEINAEQDRLFARYDANGDGFVSADELPQRRRGYGRR